MQDDNSVTSTVLTAPETSIRNRHALASEREASCYACLQVFPTGRIQQWTDKGETACCPNCHIDAVLPGRIDPNILSKMNEHWFIRPMKC